MINKNKKTPKNMPNFSSKASEEAWACVIMSIVGISNVEAVYQDKKVILGFEDLIDMTHFLHLTDLIFGGAAEARMEEKV